MVTGTTAQLPQPDPLGPMNELLHAYNTQKFKSPYGYDTGIVLVPNNIQNVSGATGRFASTIVTQADDFMVREIKGFAFGPCNALGQVNLASSGSATDFPNPINPFLAVHGVSVKITDTKTGRAWFNNPIPMECVTPKGYANQTNTKFEWNWLIPGNSTLQFEWYNADTKATPDGGLIQYHAAYVFLVGERYNGLRVTG